jgi:peroxiredoxin
MLTSRICHIGNLVMTFIIIITVFGFFSCQGNKKKEEPIKNEQDDISLSESDKAFYDELKDKLNKAYLAAVQKPQNTLSYDFTLKTLSGDSTSLSDFKGTVVFLNFWAIWCSPCRSEMPSMQKLYEEMKKDGFVLLAVNIGESREDVEAFVKKTGLTIPILLDTEKEVSRTYGASSIPITWIIDKKGNIVGAAQGARVWNSNAIKDLIRFMLNQEE